MSGTSRGVVLFSTADWKTRYWTNKQHNAALLAASGYPVLYIETVGIRRAHLMDRSDILRLWQRLVSGLRTFVLGPVKVRKDLWVLSPLSLPWGRRYRFTRWLNAFLLRSSVQRFCRRHFERPQIWTYHPFVLDVIADLPRAALVYQSVDDIAAVPGVDAEAFLAAEAELLPRCDAVFVTARILEHRYAALSDRVHFVTNVVDADHFAAAFDAPEPQDLHSIPHPRLGYHGVLSDQKIDVALLEALATGHPDWQLVLIGDERVHQDPASFAVLRRLRNVHFLGGREYAELPAYLRGFDVGILPLARNAYTLSMYPMKYFEYLAAGVPVVSTDLPYAQDTGAPIAIASDAEGFADAVSAQLARGRLTQAEARDAVGDHTYARRLEAMLAVLAGEEFG